MRSLSALLVFALASIATALDAGELRASTILTLPPPILQDSYLQTDARETPRLRLTGMIEAGDVGRLREMLIKLQASSPGKTGMPLATIELSSLGGNLAEGVRIGELLRSFKVVAVVRKQDVCLSACALALLGGTAVRIAPAYPSDCNVEIGGKVAFHNFFLDRTALRDVTLEDPVASRLQGFADARGGAAMLIRYAADLGLPPAFVANLMARPVEEFQHVETIGEFLALNLCPAGLDRPALPMSHQAVNVCNNSLAASAPLSAFIVGPIAAPQVRQYMLERVQAGMNAARTKGRLADQLATWSLMRIKDEVDRLYDDLRAAGVALPELVGPTFEVSLNQSGRVRPACYVSLSATDPDKYEVVLQGERGLTEAIRKPPANARRMFLFDRLTVANQRPSFDLRDVVLPDIEGRPAPPLSSGVVPRRAGTGE